MTEAFFIILMLSGERGRLDDQLAFEVRVT